MEPPPLSAAPPPSSPIWAVLGHLLVHGIATVFVLGTLVSLVPKVEKIFADYDAELPVVTQNILDASDWAVSNWFLSPVLLVLDGALLWGLYRLPRPWSSTASAASLLIMVGFVAWFLYTLVALVLPLIGIHEHLMPAPRPGV